jgi:hypothetical protein
MLRDSRAAFFNDHGEMIPPFRRPDWRGCCVDPNPLPHPKVHPVLFESILAAATPNHLLLQRYTPDDSSPMRLSPEWASLKDARSAKDLWSLEFVLSDESGSWALWVDQDMLVFGANPEVAARIEERLSLSGLSLQSITLRDFSSPPCESRIRHYIAEVVGRDPWQSAP